MNLKSKITTIAAASILALGLASPALAGNTTVSQEISAGSVLKAELVSPSRLGSTPYSHEAQQTNGTLVLKVEDGRGTNAGWNVTMSAGPFNPTSGTNGQAIPNKGFRFVDGGQFKADAGSTNGIQTGQQNSSLASAATVLRAGVGNGTGIFHQDLNVSLDIPAGQLVGTYQSDVTVNITSGPGQ